MVKKLAEVEMLFLNEEEPSTPPLFTNKISGDMELYVNNVYDTLDEYDFMVMRHLDGKPIEKEEALERMRWLVDNMSEDGQPLIWRLYDGKLWVMIDREAAAFGILAYKQYRMFLTREALEDSFGKAMVNRLEGRFASMGRAPIGVFEEIRLPRRYKSSNFGGNIK